MNKDVYLDVVLAQVPRLLGLLDRNPLSKTFGCGDRQFWQYKLVPFPGARFQEACLTLALLYQLDHKKNPYFKNRLLLQWIKASIKFWVHMQRKNGSFDEWYPFEHSFVATAFSAGAIAETVVVMPELQSPEVVAALESAGHFLMKNNEIRVQNQLAGAVFALYNIFLVTKKDVFKQAAWKKLAAVEQLQSAEGWLVEYGGVDPGYLSLAVDYLAKVYQKSKSMDVLVTAEKAVSFLHALQHPDGSVGGVYGSRNTEYCISAGVEVLPSATAGSLAYHVRRSLQQNKMITPAALDDRYLAFLLYTYLQAFMFGKKTVKPLPRSRVTKFFADAGLVVQQDPFFCIINVHKGGAVRAVWKDMSLHDAGIQVRTARSRVFSGYMQPVVELPMENKVKVDGYLMHTTDTVMSSWKMFVLHGFQYTLGRCSWVSKLLKSLLRDRLIQGVKKSKIRFSREIVYHPTLTITDTIFNVPPCQIIVGC